MKKLIILALVALLAGGAAFAQAKVEFTGQIEYETGTSLRDNQTDGTAFMGGGTDGAGAAAGQVSETGTDYSMMDADVQLTANITIDEYNKGLIKLRQRTFTGTEAVNGLFVDQAFFTTNVGKALALDSMGLGWTSKAGLDRYALPLSGNGRWNVLNRVIPQSNNWSDNFFDEQQWGIQQSFVFNNMITIQGYASLQSAYDNTAQPNRRANLSRKHGSLQDWHVELLFKQAAGPGEFNLGGGYLVWSNPGLLGNGTADSAGNFSVEEGYAWANLGYQNVKLQGDMSLDFGAIYYYNVSQEGDNEEDGLSDIWGANLQVNFGVMGSYFMIGAQGYPDWDEHEFHNLRLAMGVTPIALLSLDVGAILYFGDGTHWYDPDDYGGREWDNDGILNTLDFSGCLNIGNAKYRVGYLYVPEGQASIQSYQGGIGSAGDMLKSALYLKATYAF